MLSGRVFPRSLRLSFATSLRATSRFLSADGGMPAVQTNAEVESEDAAFGSSRGAGRRARPKKSPLPESGLAKLLNQAMADKKAKKKQIELGEQRKALLEEHHERQRLEEEEAAEEEALAAEQENSVAGREAFIAQCNLNPQTLPPQVLGRLREVMQDRGRQFVKANASYVLDGLRLRNSNEKPRPLPTTLPTVEGPLPADATAPTTTKTRTQKEEVAPPMNYDIPQALAYTVLKAPQSFAVTSRVLKELKYRLPEFKPKSALDFGAGPGLGAWAIHNVWPEQSADILAVEANEAMTSIGKKLTEDLSSVRWQYGLHASTKKFDLIVAAYVFDELKDKTARNFIAETLWRTLSDNGLLVLIEPGTPKGFRYVHEFREFMLSSFDIASLVAPCPHSFACPVAVKGKGWCNFAQGSTVLPPDVYEVKTHRHVVEERFSYMVFKKGSTPRTEGKTIEQVDTPDQKSFFWDRIVRPTKTRVKHVLFNLCTTEGKEEQRVVSKSHGASGGYKYAKEAEWGDLWNYPLWRANDKNPKTQRRRDHEERVRRKQERKEMEKEHIKSQKTIVQNLRAKQISRFEQERKRQMSQQPAEPADPVTGRPLEEFNDDSEDDENRHF